MPLVVEDDAGNGRIKVVHNCTIFLCSLDVYSMPWSVSLLAVFFCDCIVHKAFGKNKNALGLIFLW